MAGRFMPTSLPTAFSAQNLPKRRPDGAVGRCPAALQALIPSEKKAGIKAGI